MRVVEAHGDLDVTVRVSQCRRNRPRSPATVAALADLARHAARLLTDSELREGNMTNKRCSLCLSWYEAPGAVVACACGVHLCGDCRTVHCCAAPAREAS